MFGFSHRLRPFKPRRTGIGFLLLGDLFTYGLIAYLALGGWSLFQLLWARHILGGAFLGVWLLGTWGLGIWAHNFGLLRWGGAVSLVLAAFALTLILGFAVS
jgi:hypothetical protein